MGHRLTQISTRTGDDGTTGLGDGQRVPKNHLRIAAMGDVDELNSQLGVLLAEPLPADVRELLVVIQHELFNLGGELSIPGYTLIKVEAVIRLDEALAHHNAQLPRLQEFILPAGTRSAALEQQLRSYDYPAAVETLRALRQHGLTWVDTDGGEHRVAVNASDDPASLGVQDLVIVSVKGPAMPAVAMLLAL